MNTLKICMVTLFCLLATPTIQSITVEEFCVDVKVGESAGVELGSVESDNGKMVDDLQEFRGGNKLKSVLVDEGDMQEYGTSIVAYATTGIVLSVLSFLGCTCISVCRLFNKCFKPTREYNRKDKLVVLGVYLFFALGCMICAILGSVSLGKFVNSSSDIMCSMESLRVDTEGFFTKMMLPVDQLKVISSQNIDKISENLMSVSTVGEKNEEIITLTSSFGENVSNINVHPNVTCSFCIQTGESINATAKQLRETVRPQLTDMEETFSTLNDQVVLMKSIIIEIVDGAKASVNALVEVVEVTFKSMMESIMTSANSIRKQIVTVGTAFFALSFVVMVFTLLGVAIQVCGAYTNCSKVKCIDELDDQVGRMLVWLAWEITFVFVIILFLLAGLMLPVGVVISDACVVLDDFPTNIGEYLTPVMGPGQGVTILEGCFEDKSLFVLLNMTSAFAFKDQLSFGTSDSFNSSQTFNFGEFDKMRQTIHGLTYKNFSAPGSDIDEDIETAENYNQTARANELKLIRTNGNNSVIWMQNDIDVIQLRIEDLQNLTKTMQIGLNKSKPYINEILSQVDVILGGGKCGFIAPQYKSFTDIMCGGFLQSILELSLFCFLCGLFGIFMICGNLNIQRRFGAHGEYDPHAKDEMFGMVRGLTFKKMPTESAAVLPMNQDATDSSAIIESEYVGETADVVEVPIQSEGDQEEEFL